MGSQFYWNPYGGLEATTCMLLGELSNPFLVYRTILKLKGEKNTLKYKVCELLFMFSFLVL